MIGRFFRNPETGKLVIAQAPNAPLAVFLVARVAQLVVPEGWPRALTSVVATAGLGWWAVDEIVRGDSPFRRVLGAAVLALLLRGLLT